MMPAVSHCPHPAHWPLPARLALLLLAAVACGTGGMLCYLPQREAMRDEAQARLQALRARLEPAFARAAQLDALRVREGQLRMQVAAQAEQLWPATDLPILRDKLSRRATECGLTLESFKPASQSTTHEQGAELDLSGSYGAMRCFVERTSAPPRPVRFARLDITLRQANDTPSGQARPASLLLQTTVQAASTAPELDGDPP